MVDKKQALTGAKFFFLGLVIVLVFASTSWAARVDADNQSGCDVMVTYDVSQPLGLGANALKGFDVNSGRKGYQDEFAFWTYKVAKVAVYLKSNNMKVCETRAPEDKTYYHSKVVVTGDDENSLRCEITFY